MVPTAVGMNCYFNNTEMLIRHKKITLRVLIGTNYTIQTKIDICYQHIEKQVEAVVCTSPIFGFPKLISETNNNNNKNNNKNKNKFWFGENPPYSNGHTLLDTFIAYYAISLNFRVALYELEDNLKEYLSFKYKNFMNSTNIYHRANWSLPKITTGCCHCSVLNIMILLYNYYNC